MSRMTPSHPSQKTIQLSELLPGDLIFTIENSSKVVHVEIYGGQEVFNHTSFHAGYVKQIPALSRTMAIMFKPHPLKRVYRCKRLGLGAKVAKYAKQWAAFETKYDLQRAQLQEQYSKFGPAQGEGRRSMMRRLFLERGRYRAVKVTARRNSVLCSPWEDGESGSGMTDCMYALSCCHAAVLEDHVDPLEKVQAYFPRQSIRISDKKTNMTNLRSTEILLKSHGFDHIDIGLYSKYLQTLNEKEPYGLRFPARASAARLPNVNYYPSLYFWKTPPFHSFDFAAVMTPALLLDAKIATRLDFLQSIQANPENWRDLGTLPNIPDAALSEQEKQAYKTTLAERRDAAGNLRSQFGLRR